MAHLVKNVCGGEVEMASYKTFTTCGDMGPWVSKLILELPGTARANDVDCGSFNVYVERIDLEKGGLAFAAEHHGGPKLPSRGYVNVLAAYVCDEKGNATGLIVEKHRFLISYFSSQKEFSIRWEQIEKIGEDVILVNFK